MGFLLVAICSSATIALIFKATEGRGGDRLVIAWANYMLAAAVAVVLLATGSAASLPLGTADARAALGVGLLGGLVFFAGFIVYQRAVREHGASLAGAFAKLGILLPLVLSMVIWAEWPSLLQAVAIALALAAVVLANRPREGSAGGGLKWALMLLFLLGGLGEFLHKVFERHSTREHLDWFLVAVFGTAFLASSAVVLARRVRPRGRDVLSGMAVAIPNLMSSMFLVLALGRMSAPVAYALFGAGTIALIAVGSRVIFGERLTRAEAAASALVAVALVLLNLGA
jgi:drug/metabolite transporter (DMT)-like permease